VKEEKHAKEGKGKPAKKAESKGLIDVILP
jgi:hypothetical protein